MSRTKIKFDREVLHRLYWKEGLSPYKIGEMYGCSFSTITNRFKEFGIARKDNSVARERYSKKNFSGNKTEKAYILGFRIGDLNVYKTNKDSKVIIARCHTTTQDQLDVISKLFSKYGKVTISKNNGSYHINCFVNISFDFLLDKQFDCNQISDEEEFYAFFAGYLDAEGYVGINQGRARLKIDSYDLSVLDFIHRKLDMYGIRNKTRMISVCGDKRNFGKELWRINVNFAEDLHILFSRILPYCLHKKRMDQIYLAEQNILNRKKNAEQD